MMPNTMKYIFLIAFVFEKCSGCFSNSLSDTELPDSIKVTTTTTMIPDTTKEYEKSNFLLGVIVLFAVLAVILIAVVAYIILQRRRKIKSLWDIVRDMKENDYTKTPSNSINFRLNDILRNQNPEIKAISTNFSKKLGYDNGSMTDDMKEPPKSQQFVRTLSALKGTFKITSAIEVHQTRQGSTSHLETLNDVNDANAKQYSDDEKVVYEKGFCNSTSYKKRLASVLQNETSEKLSSNIDLLNEKDGKTQNVDWSDVDKIIIEDNPYYGQI